MAKVITEKKSALLLKFKEIIEPVLARLETIDSKISGNSKSLKPGFYRNEDLKKIFGLSTNTIVKYRRTGILPYTKLGDIFLYEAKKIEKILHDNEV
ncbi:DNA-binding protein [Flavobacterium luteolum]|uniref:DNA-binding protein n=1 Tax=Flavobacterium luteolum TaxID=3003259 RepID=UPI00248DEC1F|nr:DNA-binding protein [Flavobacterium luteolum]